MWFAPSLLVPEVAADELHAWVENMDWPKGTKLKDPRKYHVTLLYSAEGRKHFRHEAFLEAIQPDASFKVWTARVEQLSPGNNLHWRPISVMLSNTLLRRWVEHDVLTLASAIGLDYASYGSYKSHVTVAEIPPGDFDVWNIEPPDVTWMTPMETVDLHTYYDSL